MKLRYGTADRAPRARKLRQREPQVAMYHFSTQVRRRVPAPSSPPAVLVNSITKKEKMQAVGMRNSHELSVWAVCATGPDLAVFSLRPPVSGERPYCYFETRCADHSSMILTCHESAGTLLPRSASCSLDNGLAGRSPAASC